MTIKSGTISYYDIGAMIQDSESHVVVAEVEGKIVASGYAIPKRARHYLDHEWYAYLGFMYTDVAYRGRGINAQIVEELKQWSHAKGFQEIRLTVYNDNISAIKAYEKVGFKKTHHRNAVGIVFFSPHYPHKLYFWDKPKEK